MKELCLFSYTIINKLNDNGANYEDGQNRQGPGRWLAAIIISSDPHGYLWPHIQPAMLISPFLENLLIEILYHFIKAGKDRLRKVLHLFVGGEKIRHHDGAESSGGG